MPVVSIRIPKHVYEALQELAKRNNMSLYEYVRHVLEKHVADSLRSEVSSSKLSDVSYSDSIRKQSDSKLGEVSYQQSDSILQEVSDSQNRDVSYNEVSYQNDDSKPSQSKLSELLRTLVEKVKDLEERVKIIEQVHWGVAEINKRIQVYDGDSEEGRKILEEIKQKGLKPVEKSEGNGIAVEIYNT